MGMKTPTLSLLAAAGLISACGDGPASSPTADTAEVNDLDAALPDAPLPDAPLPDAPVTGDTARLSLAFAGVGPGLVEVDVGDDVPVTCSAACELDLPRGATVTLRAASPSVVAGFAGACVDAAATCAFVLDDDAAVTATFDAAADEAWSRLLDVDQTVRSVDHDGAGNVVLGTTTGLVKLSATGTDVWTRADLPGHARVAPDDSIIVAVDDTRLVKVDSAGVDVWDVATTGLHGCNDESRMARWLAATPAGGVVVFNGGVRQFGPDGVLQWSQATTAFCHLAVAVSPAGVVNVGVENANAESTDLERFAADGTRLATLEQVTGQYWFALDIAADGDLACSAAGHSYVGIYRFDAADAQVGWNEFDTDSGDYVENGVAASADGTTASAVPLDSTAFIDGLQLRRLARDGTLLLTSIRPDVVAYDLDASAAGTIAVGGTFWSSDEASPRGWVTSFAALPAP